MRMFVVNLYMNRFWRNYDANPVDQEINRN